MDLYRIQLGKHRLATKRKIPIVDTTAKNSVSRLAPEWDIVIDYKNSKKTVDDIAVYSVRYLEQLNMLWRVDKKSFLDIVNQEQVAIACMCAQDEKAFCHLEILVECLEKVCEFEKIPFNYKGIIK